jgi:hypothetical protein
MQNRTLLAAIATAAVVAIAAPSASNAQVPQTSKGEVALKPSFGSLMSAINGASAQTDKLKALTTPITAESVQLVNVQDLVQGNDVDALKSAMKTNEANIAAQRDALGKNTGLSDALAAAKPESIAPTDVVATEVTPDGKVVVYYWKKGA